MSQRQTTCSLVGKKTFDEFTSPTFVIQFNNATINRATSLKILGLIIDESLSFKDHVHAIQIKVISFTFALRRCRKYISDKTAVSLYYANIQSHFIYMSSIITKLI
jgi:hypothetical protein